MAAQEFNFSDLYVLMKHSDEKNSISISQINMTNNRQMTLAHFAAQEGYWGAISMLIRKGADFSLKDNSNRTALHCAVEHHYFFAFMLAQKITKRTGKDFRCALLEALGETPITNPAMVSLLIRVLSKISLEEFSNKHFIEIFSEMQLEAETIDKFLPHIIGKLNPSDYLSIQWLCKTFEQMATQGSILARQLYLRTSQKIAVQSQSIDFIQGAELLAIHTLVPVTSKIPSDSPILCRQITCTDDEDTLAQDDMDDCRRLCGSF